MVKYFCKKVVKFGKATYFKAMKLLYIHLLMGLLLTYIDAFVAFFKESGNKYHFEKVEKPG